MRKSGDEVEVQIGDTRRPQNVAISCDNFRGMPPAGPCEFARDEGLHAQAHASDAEAVPDLRLFTCDGAGRRLDRRLSPWPSRNEIEHRFKIRETEIAGGTSA